MTGPARMPVAEVRSLRIDYAARNALVHAVQDASLHVGEGETVGVVGESGSGKSTLARSLLGLLHPRLARIAGGRITIAGRDVTGHTPRQWEALRGNPVAMVFQDPLSFLNPVMTVGKQIRESILLHDKEAQATSRVRELLDLVKLPQHILRSYPDELSGGMRQRALIAIALGCRPRLLVADEPTTALDVTTQAEIMRLLRDVQQATQMAMLLISHDLDLIASSCERIYVMYSGRTIEWGRAADVLGRPMHPYTQGLLAAAEGRRGADGTFVTIPGDPPDLRIQPRGCPFEPRCPERRPACDTMPPAVKVGGSDHQVRCVLAEAPARDGAAA